MNRPFFRQDLVIDVGMADGTDTTYYLWKSFNVIAIDADPLACERARHRFREEIAQGRLTILNVGIAEKRGALQFYYCPECPFFSTFDETRIQGPVKYEPMSVSCIPLADILLEHGIPHYLKVDIEGYDEIAVNSITPDTAPPYLSAELGQTDTLLDSMQALGYRSFKLINQATHTSHIPIRSRDVFHKLLRRISSDVPLVRTGVRLLPETFRSRSEWDVTYDPDHFGRSSKAFSGPFGELTHGSWLDYREAKMRIDDMRRDYSSFWYDLHARK